MVDAADRPTLGDELRAFYRAADEELRERWGRSMPFDEAVSDRWERAARLGFAEGASIYGTAAVYGDVAVGERTWIGPWVLLDGSGGGLRIGRFCSISAGVHVYTHDTVRWSLSGGAVERAIAPVEIGDRCHLGAGTVVCAGTRIGSGCVVGAQSFVKGDVPDRAVVGGSPARLLGMVRGDGADVEVWTGPDAIRAFHDLRERPEA